METLSIINKTYDLYKAVILITITLDKKWRYSLGASLEESILECLSDLVMAKNAPKSLKTPYLLKASGQAETARLKLRLFLDLKLANETKIFQAQSILEEIGRMLGGWLKSLQ